jgi:hypothetical protein
MIEATEPTHYVGDERRAGEPMEWRAHVDKRLDDGAATMKEMRASLAENTTATKQVQNDTSELVELLKSFKGAFSVLEKLGKLARPLGYIVAACTACLAFWAALKGGTK